MKLKEFLKPNWRKILVFGIFLIAFIVIVRIFLIPVVLSTIISYFCLMTVPTNPNFSIPTGLEPEKVIPADLGGMDYSEIIFNKSHDEWLSLCYEALEVDDPEDVCRGFIKGYLRVYSTYALEDGTILKENNVFITDYYFNNNDICLTRNGTLLLHVIEYETPRDAKSACSFLTVDLGGYYSVVPLNGVKIIGWEREDRTHYAFPSGKFLISIQGSSRASRDAIGRVIGLYKEKNTRQ